MKKKQIQKIITRTIVENDGRVLLVRRSQTDKSRKGIWELPGGGVELSESLEEAAAREVLEETGLVIEAPDFFESAQYIHPDGSRRLGAVFHGNTKNDNIITSSEHDAFKWIDISNINNVKMEQSHKESLHKYYKTDVQSHNHMKIVELNTTNISNAVVFTDGGSRGNPGPSAAGYVIMNKDKQILLEGGEYLGVTTNNQAEYQAVRTALDVCLEHGFRKLDFFIDSMLVVNQLNGTFKVKNRDLWPIHENIKKLSRQFDAVTYTHVTRDKNKLADAKVNEVLDNHR